MFYVYLTKFWWKWAKDRGVLKDNGKYGIRYVKVKRIGIFSRIFGVLMRK